MELAIYCIFFFLVALIYSSAGFGGGSSYLALLSQLPYGQSFIRLTGLSCNTIVTAVGTYNFYRKGWVMMRPLLGLLMASVPFCIWSASWRLESHVYFITLGSCLLVAGILMMLQSAPSESANKPIKNPWWLYILCAAIGLLSGFTGIGGGVYLSPLLHFIRWGSAKHIAATCSAFILVNSIAGLVGQIAADNVQWNIQQLWLLLSVFAGGMIGSRLSSSILSQRTVRQLTACVIVFAAVRILIKYL
ncbi:MAG TPA: sulfite exporter TauE/SafE family protein [Flavobacteriales bacterium]